MVTSASVLIIVDKLLASICWFIAQVSAKADMVVIIPPATMEGRLGVRSVL